MGRGRFNHQTNNREKENDVFVKLKVYEALNGQQQSKIAKKRSKNKIIIKKGRAAGRREARAREAVCVQ